MKVKSNKLVVEPIIDERICTGIHVYDGNVRNATVLIQIVALATQSNIALSQ